MSAFYEMSEMTSSEFRDAASTIEIALVPVGATEQHGPYLALATDYVVAHRLAQAIARRLYPEAIVAPPLVMSRCLLNIAKRSLLRLMLSCIGLASKHVAG